MIIMAIDAIARNKAEALIREQLVNTIQQDVPKSSIVMQLGTRLANMTSNQTKIPVLSMLPLAYWVNGDTGMKKTSKQEWDNVYMTAAELAVIVPVPEAVLADSWARYSPASVRPWAQRSTTLSCLAVTVPPSGRPTC